MAALTTDDNSVCSAVIKRFKGVKINEENSVNKHAGEGGASGGSADGGKVGASDDGWNKKGGQSQQQKREGEECGDVNSNNKRWGRRRRRQKKGGNKWKGDSEDNNEGDSQRQQQQQQQQPQQQQQQQQRTKRKERRPRPVDLSPRPQRDIPGFDGALTCCTDWPQTKSGRPPNAQSLIFAPLILCAIGPVEGHASASQVAVAVQWWSQALPVWPRWVEELRREGEIMSQREKLLESVKGHPVLLIPKHRGNGTSPHWRGKLQNRILEKAPRVALELYACVQCLYSSALFEKRTPFPGKEKGRRRKQEREW